jgi:hypothetical protein
MKNILTTLVVLVVGLLALRYWNLHRRDAGATAAGAPAPARTNARGFTPIPLAGLPADKVVVIAPAYCSSEEGRRADEITQELAAAGIPCVRSSSVSVTFDHQPSPDELAASDRVLRGRIPIIYIAGRAKNSPETADVIAEFRSR